MSRFLRAYEAFFRLATDAPEEYGHGSGLAILSAVSLGRRWIERGPGRINPNIYMLLAGESSVDRKSTCVRFANKFVRECDATRTGPDDFTGEGVVYHMRYRPGTGKTRNKILLSIEEFGQYLAVASRGYGQGLSTTLCKLYDGESFERVRSGKKPVKIVKPQVSLLGGVAYGMLERYADPLDWVTGFYARMIWVTPMTRGALNPVPPSTPTIELIAARDELKKLIDELKATKEANGAMQLSAPAEQMYRDFVLAHQNHDGDPASIAQRQRLNIAALKIAMLYQVDIDPQAPISQQAMDSAIEFTRKSWISFQRLYMRVSGSTLNRSTLKIWRRLWEAPEHKLTRREAMRVTHTALDEFLIAADILTKMGAIRLTPQKGGKGPIYEATQKYEFYTDDEDRYDDQDAVGTPSPPQTAPKPWEDLPIEDERVSCEKCGSDHLIGLCPLDD